MRDGDYISIDELLEEPSKEESTIRFIEDILKRCDAAGLILIRNYYRGSKIVSGRVTLAKRIYEELKKKGLLA